MTDTNHGKPITRRRALQASGTVTFTGLGTITAFGDDSTDGGLFDDEYCEQTSLKSGMIHYDGSMHQVCGDDHPESVAIQNDVRQSLAENYPTVGALIEDGFIPYFDFFADGDWAHWIQPEYIGDDEVLNPSRPESILVDNTYWRPIGVMFIATEGGDPMDPPPTVYHDEDVGAFGGDCTPWHAHVGLPGRYSWWKYETVYGDGGTLPCRTPWMMHVWTYDHEESIYAHDAPEERGGPPAEPPGFETDADPNEETLGPEHLPDAVRDRGRKMT